MTSFRPGSVDYERQAPDYARARYLSASAEAAWREALARHLTPLSAKQVLDLGSGSGRFAPLIADVLECRVVGVEPSDGMREAAMRDAAHPNVEYLPGDAASIPLADGSCDAAWLGYMLHHVPDRTLCARELTRVMRPGGLVLVVGAYTEQRRELLLFQYFPAALPAIDAFPLAAEIESDFRAGGLESVDTERVEYEYVASLAEGAARTALRADTLLRSISDDEFVAGQRKIEAAAAAETNPQPIRDGVDLLVFRRP